MHKCGAIMHAAVSLLGAVLTTSELSLIQYLPNHWSQLGTAAGEETAMKRHLVK